LKTNVICLCSSSESRALLLNNFGIDFIQKSPDYDEDKITTTVAKDFVYTASKGKLEAAIEEFGLEIPLLCADTVIAAEDGSILRKAKDIDDARRILKKWLYYFYYLLSALQIKNFSFLRHLCNILSFLKI